MNNSLTFIKYLNTISKGINVINTIIPIYNDTKPLFKNIKKFIPVFDNNKISINKNINNSDNSNAKEKEIITSNSDNPIFFI